MLQQFNQYIAAHSLANKSQKTLLAISGGADSVCMLDMFVKAGYKVAIAHVNFHLRGEDSNRDEAFVRALAKNTMLKSLQRVLTQKVTQPKNTYQ